MRRTCAASPASDPSTNHVFGAHWSAAGPNTAALWQQSATTTVRQLPFLAPSESKSRISSEVIKSLAVKGTRRVRATAAAALPPLALCG